MAIAMTMVVMLMITPVMTPRAAADATDLITAIRLKLNVQQQSRAWRRITITVRFESFIYDDGKYREMINY